MADSNEKFEEVIVIRKDGTGFKFVPDQKQDTFFDGPSRFDKSGPMREAREEVKVDAMETRERIKKAGLL